MDKKNQPDLVLFLITLVLLIIGLIMVLSASSYEAMLDYDDALHFFKRQAAFMAMGFIPMFIMMNINIDFVKRLAFPGLAISIVLLLLLPVFGVDVNGAVRWYRIGPLQFGPAEMAKPIVIVFFAMWLTALGKKNLRTFKGFFITLLILAVVPVLIIGEDLGTAVCIAGAMFCMLIVAEVPVSYLIGLACTAAAGVAAMIVAEPYRVQRILAFLDPFADPLGKGYQVVQSLYAIGSGSMFGVGLGASRQKLMHLPEMHTDFIFSIIGEELGFLGAAFVILLFAAFIWRGFLLSSQLEDRFMTFTAFGLTASIGIQAMINIGVAVGAFPVTGIPLPFISYGGSSLIFMMATVGFLLNLSKYAKK
ncbi:MAG: putative lipid II flippase FtsW [Peptococcaceae bacterium]|nr:putative lipid II flippase FtsW [Peptococcaceae bacterium]MBQ3206245.1 putative lipid II flippase FtsW [Peptococcaceae bacterium]